MKKYSRNAYPNLLAQKDNPKASILIGPRQVGKTSLFKQLHSELGGVFLDLDIVSQYDKISSYEKCLQLLKLNGYKIEQTHMFYLFLDEFQRHTDLSMILKNIIDHHPNIKIYATGSSSLTIKDAIQESLAGRKLISYLYPLSFEEFLRFKEQDELIKQLTVSNTFEETNIIELLPAIQPLLNEFMIYGGYPEVVLSKTPAEKQAVLTSIFDLYLKKDIREYLQIQKFLEAKKLLERMAINHGQLFNATSYTNHAGIDIKTVQHYQELFEETFLVQTLRPFFSNKNKEVSKMPKLYFLDNGVRNHFIHNFIDLQYRQDTGALFESLCMSELLKAGHQQSSLKYYRNHNQQEVDIIIDQVSRQIPIEIKWSNKIKQSHTSHLRSFMKRYEISKGYVITPFLQNTKEKLQYLSFPQIDTVEF